MKTSVQGPEIVGHIVLPEPVRKMCQCDHCNRKWYGNSSFGKLWPQEILVSGKYETIAGKQYPVSKIVTKTEYWCQDCLDDAMDEYWEQMESSSPQTSRGIFDTHEDYEDYIN